MHKLRLSAMGGLVLVLLLAGCGGSSSAPVKIASQKVSKACQRTPHHGGSLTYARAIETVSLNPLQAKNGNGDIFAQAMLFTGLVGLDPAGGNKVVPDLAESWDVSPDGKTYTFHLRPGIKFSNGQPITPEDIKFSLDRFANPKLNTILPNLAQGYKSTEIVNASTVRVQLSQPVAAFLDNISVFPAFIVPKKEVEQGGNAFWQHPVGSGPFEVKAFVTGSHLTMVPNPHWWEKGKPYVSTLTFNFDTDSNTRVLAVQSGSAQIADGIPYSQITSLQGNVNLVVAKVPVPAWLGISLNNTEPEFKDINVRKAMQYALNRAEINSAILHGVGSTPNSILPADLVPEASASEVKPYTYDLAKAKALMAKSKFPHGFSTTLDYPSGIDYYNQLTLVIQQEWAAIGIHVKLVEEDPATVFNKFFAMKYDTAFPAPQLSSDVPVPDEFASFYTGTATNGFFSGWNDPTLRKAVETFVSTTSVSSRDSQWTKIQGEMLDQTPVINVMNVPFIIAHRANVCGTDVNALGVDQLQNTWIAPAGS